MSDYFSFAFTLAARFVVVHREVGHSFPRNDFIPAGSMSEKTEPMRTHTTAEAITGILIVVALGFHKRDRGFKAHLLSMGMLYTLT